MFVENRKKRIGKMKLQLFKKFPRSVIFVFPDFSGKWGDICFITESS